MEKHTLSAQERTKRGHGARREAVTRIPAIVYGHGMEAMSIWVEATDFARVFKRAGETGVIELKVDGEKKAMPTIVRAIQHSPLKHEIIHIDFYKVSLKEAVTADVPVVLTGESEAVKKGGTLIHGADTIEISALPNELPHEITVDISSLETFEDSITVADITVPGNVNIVSDPSLLVVGMAATRIEKEDEPAQEESAEDATEDKGEDQEKSGE